MKVATRDRGDVLHFAGRHGLSPALRAGVPTLVAGNDPEAVRCGWEAFFRAMGDRGLVLVHAPDEASSAELRPLADTRDVTPEHPARLAPALERTRRFWRALFPARSG